MATQAKSPQEVTAARNFATERAAIRAKLSEAKDEKVIRDLNQQIKEVDADETNASRTGVGKRVRVGQTRGKNPQIITWEAYDDSKPETLPTTIQQFMDVDGTKDEPSLVGFLIAGSNEASYTSASDPLAEFVDLSWPSDAQTQFRLVVRNYSRGAGVSLEDAVSLIKPGFSKQFTPAATA